MTRNFRKSNHTKASGNPRPKVCAYCRRKLPPAEFTDQHMVRRRVAFPNDLKGPGWRTVERTHPRCRVCRRLPFGFESYMARNPGIRTPIRMAMVGLPDTRRWAMGF